MSLGDDHAAAVAGQAGIQRYYRFHSRIYDATRWSFLFGRNALVERVARDLDPSRVLEIGTGTGKNLVQLCRTFPEATVYGLDISTEMLDVARRKVERFGERVELIHRPYDGPDSRGPRHELIVFSYSLSMINPGWERAIDSAYEDLVPGGHVAVVDFDASPVKAFKRWMGVNHVRMDGHLLPVLQSRFETRDCEVRAAYGGLWKYLTFVGRKP